MMLVRMLSLGKERFKIMHINYVLISILFTCIKKKNQYIEEKKANNTFVFSETADTVFYANNCDKTDRLFIDKI